MVSKELADLVARKTKELNERADVKKHQGMSREEKARDAIERCTERHIEFERRHGNSNVSADQVRKTYVDIAERVDKTGGQG